MALALRKAVILSKRKRVGGAGMSSSDGGPGVVVEEDIFLFSFLLGGKLEVGWR